MDLEWGLNQPQKKIIESICLSQMCTEISRTLYNKLKHVISDSFVKKYTLLEIEDHYSSEVELDRHLLQWVRVMLEYNRVFLNSITTMDKIIYRDRIFSPFEIHKGAGYMVSAVRHNSSMHCKPYTLPVKEFVTSSSIFLNSKPDAIINISKPKKKKSLNMY